MDTKFRQRSKALGDKTRLAIYRELARAEVPLGVADLVARFALNHNTVRQHLSKLAEADLIDAVHAPPDGPGRPPVRYRLTDDAAARWNGDGPYERLSLLLLEVATTDSPPLEVGRSAGRAMPVIDANADDPVATFTTSIAAQGFAPHASTHDLSDSDPTGPGTPIEVVLDHCPYAAAANANPEVVCALHRGMVEGLAERIGGLAVTGLDVSEPNRAGCRVRLVRNPARG